MNDEYESPSATAAPEDTQAYTELVRTVVSKLVEHPDQVEVTAVDRGRAVVIEVSVAPEDMGKAIGKGGRNIDSLRSVARAAGLRQHQRVQVELLETDDE